MSKGVNEKNFMSLPASIPITIETAGLTRENSIIATSIPASAFTVFTATNGIISIVVTMIAKITIVRFIRFVVHPPYLSVFKRFAKSPDK